MNKIEDMTNTNKLTSTDDYGDNVLVTCESDARDHNVTVQVSLSSNDYATLAAALPEKVHRELETKREIAIMHEVLQHDGGSIIEKIDNTIEDWESESHASIEIVPGLYKLQHRHVINSK